MHNGADCRLVKGSADIHTIVLYSNGTPYHAAIGKMSSSLKVIQMSTIITQLGRQGSSQCLWPWARFSSEPFYWFYSLNKTCRLSSKVYQCFFLSVRCSYCIPTFFRLLFLYMIYKQSWLCAPYKEKWRRSRGCPGSSSPPTLQTWWCPPAGTPSSPRRTPWRAQSPALVRLPGSGNGRMVVKRKSEVSKSTSAPWSDRKIQ